MTLHVRKHKYILHRSIKQESEMIKSIKNFDKTRLFLKTIWWTCVFLLQIHQCRNAWHFHIKNGFSNKKHNFNKSANTKVFIVLLLLYFTINQQASKQSVWNCKLWMIFFYLQFWFLKNLGTGILQKLIFSNKITLLTKIQNVQFFTWQTLQKFKFKSLSFFTLN